jgi:hypothetical protein
LLIRIFAIALALFIPFTAVSAGFGPPLPVPAEPAAPPVTPASGAPPVLDLILPSPSAPPSIPITLPNLPAAPPFEPPAGIPDLTELVDLPPEAANVYLYAPPFGAPIPSLGRATPHIVPEPSTAALLSLGLVGFAAARRRRGGA